MPSFLGRFGDAISESDLRQIPCPAPTSSWHPIPHHYVYSAIMSCVRSFNFQASSVSHFVTPSRCGYMALVDLSIPQADPSHSYGLILQSSIDKSLPFRVFFGSSLRLCSNGMVLGTNIQAIRRKHTIPLAEVEQSLAEKVLPIFHRFSSDLQAFNRRLTTLRTTPAPTGPALSDTLIRAAREDIISGSQIMQVLSYFENPASMTTPLPTAATTSDAGTVLPDSPSEATATMPLTTTDPALIETYRPGSVYCLQSAFSAAYRDRLSPFSLSDKLARLNPFVDSLLPTPTPEPALP